MMKAHADGDIIVSCGAILATTTGKNSIKLHFFKKGLVLLLCIFK